MANDTRKRVIECRAARLRTQEWELTQSITRVMVKRVALGLDGHPVRWITQLAPGPHRTLDPDLFSNPASNLSHDPRNHQPRQDPPRGPDSIPPAG